MGNLSLFTRLDKRGTSDNAFVRGAKMLDVRFAEHLAIFVETARSGSFSVAARARSLSPSAVARRIDDLEAALEAKLFLRSTRRLRLTEAGEVLLERAAVILNGLADLKAEVSSIDGAMAGTFRIACLPTFGRKIVMPVLDELCAQNSGLRFELDLTEKLDDPVLDRMDAVIRIGALADSTLITTKVGTQNMILCASPGYLGKAGDPGTAKELLRHRLLDKASGADLLRWTDVFEDRQDVAMARQRAVLKCDDFDVLRDAACRGVGIARLASWVVCADLQQGRLVRLQAAPHVSAAEPIVVLRSLRRQTAKFSAFGSALRKALAAVEP